MKTVVFVFVFILRWGLIIQSRLTLNSLYNPCWPWTSDPPASASRVLEDYRQVLPCPDEQRSFLGLDMVMLFRFRTSQMFYPCLPQPLSQKLHSTYYSVVAEVALLHSFSYSCSEGLEEHDSTERSKKWCRKTKDYIRSSKGVKWALDFNSLYWKGWKIISVIKRANFLVLCLITFLSILKLF